MYNLLMQRLRTSNGRALQRSFIQIGDNTLAYFCLTIGHNHLGSTIHVGDVVLLQNVKLVKYGEFFEAVATHISSVQILLQSCDLVATTGMDELLARCQLGIGSREKLKKVIKWAQQTESVLQDVRQVPYQNKAISKNWKSQEENNSRNCTSVLEVLHLTESCNVNFLACTGEIVVQFRRPNEAVKDNVLLGKRLVGEATDRIVEEIICIGCNICGSPVDSRYSLEEMKFPLYCQDGPNYLHSVCSIYRPFLLRVWDQSKQITLLVKNRAAEMLFANITAEDVCKSYRVKRGKLCEREPWPDMGGPSCSKITGDEETTVARRKFEPADAAKDAGDRKKPDFYSIWLVLVKLLLHCENSPFKFEVCVDLEKDQDSGRFELVSFTMPCYP